jgi:putative transposase
LGNYKVAEAMDYVSIAKFYAVLEYKCAWYGKNLIQIRRFVPAGKRFNGCGHRKEDLTLMDQQG